MILNAWNWIIQRKEIKFILLSKIYKVQFQPIFLSGLVESPLQDKLRLERQNVGFGVGESAVGVGVSVGG